MTVDELAALGFVVKNGVAVPREKYFEPPAPPAADARAWPVMRFALPRPVSLLRETPEQAKVAELFRKCGCRTKSTSQFRKSKVALGIPDLWVFGPNGSGLAWWWETKSGEDWSFSVDQLEWAGLCMRSNTLYGAGDRFSAEAFLDLLHLQPIG